MVFQPRWISPWLALLAAVALALAPIFPAIAPVAKAASTAPGHHVEHAAEDGSAVAQALASDLDPGAPCAQHDGCHGLCCAACAQCFTAVAVFAALDWPQPVHPVRVPTATRLALDVLPATLIRPPQALSLA